MALTYSLNKYENGETIDADVEQSNWSYLLNNIMNFILDGVTITNQFNVVKNPSISTASNALIGDLTDNQSAVFCLVIDNIDDSSIDSNIWSTTANDGGGANASASVTEDTSRIRATTAGGDLGSDPQTEASFISDQVNGFDGRALSGNSEVFMTLSLSKSDGNTGSNAGTTAELNISNGTTAVNLYDAHTSGNLSSAKINLLFNKSGEEVRLFVNGVEDGSSPFDISSVTTNWYIEIVAHADGGGGTSGDAGNATADLFHIGYIDGNSATGQITTSSTSLDKASTRAICRLKSDQNDETDFTVKASADNGSNFTTLGMDSTVGGAGLVTKGLTSGSTALLRFEKAIETTVSTTVPAIVEHELDFVALFG